MLLTTLLILSVAINITLAILLTKKIRQRDDLQLKVNVLQQWGDKTFAKLKKLEQTRESLLQYVHNVGKEEAPTKALRAKKTRRSPKKKK
jgi:DNA repair protein RadC